MNAYFTHDLVIHLILFQVLLLIIVLSNLIILHRARRHSAPQAYPLVSILVPARNEAKNIKKCVQSLLTQDYPAFELLVLDDQSTDETSAIVNEAAKDHPQLKLLFGSPTPAGWTGKNWACAQLAQHAQGEYLFFTDADTFHRPQALRQIITAMLGEQADLLTGFPQQITQTWGEKLLVPFFSWAALSFIPFGLAYHLPTAEFSSAVGQVMCFRRPAYQTIGGHEAIKDEIAEDLLLARRIKKARLNWRVVHVSDLIACRMYRGSHEAIQGLAKSLFAAFDFRLIPYFFVYLWLGLLFEEPLIVLLAYLYGHAPLAQVNALLPCIGLSLILWLLPLNEIGTPLRMVFLYPLIIPAAIGVAFYSAWLSLAGKLSWKDRPLARPKWKWL